MTVFSVQYIFSNITYDTNMYSIQHMIIMLLFLAYANAQTTQNTFHVNHVMSYLAYLNPIWTYVSVGPIQCALQCTQTPDCVSALYDEQLHTCTLDASEEDISGPPCDVKIFDCLTYIKKAPDLNGETVGCSTNEECVGTNMECRYGQCYCNIGYSYNKSENGCTFGCDVWGNTYQPDLGKQLTDFFSPMDFDNVDNLTACFDWCTTKISFTCILIEFDNIYSACVIYSPTTDQSASNREAGGPVDLYTRDCGP